MPINRNKFTKWGKRSMTYYTRRKIFGVNVQEQYGLQRVTRILNYSM